MNKTEGYIRQRFADLLRWIDLSFEDCSTAFDCIKAVLRCRFVRFLLTGALNTLVGYLIYSAVYFTVGNVTLALILDYVICLFFNFASYSTLVFGDKKEKLLSFVVVYIFVFILNRVSLFVFEMVFGINAYAAQIISLSYVSILLFFLLKKFVFTQTTSTQ